MVQYSATVCIPGYGQKSGLTRKVIFCEEVKTRKQNHALPITMKRGIHDGVVKVKNCYCVGGFNHKMSSPSQKIRKKIL